MLSPVTMLGPKTPLKIEIPVTVVGKPDLTLVHHGEVLLETKLLLSIWMEGEREE